MTALLPYPQPPPLRAAPRCGVWKAAATCAPGPQHGAEQPLRKQLCAQSTQKRCRSGVCFPARSDKWQLGSVGVGLWGTLMFPPEGPLSPCQVVKKRQQEETGEAGVLRPGPRLKDGDPRCGHSCHERTLPGLPEVGAAPARAADPSRLAFLSQPDGFGWHTTHMGFCSVVSDRPPLPVHWRGSPAQEDLAVSLEGPTLWPSG